MSESTNIVLLVACKLIILKDVCAVHFIAYYSNKNLVQEHPDKWAIEPTLDDFMNEITMRCYFRSCFAIRRRYCESWRGSDDNVAVSK